MENVRFDITANMPGYALVQARGGFKLQPVEPGDGSDTSHSAGAVQPLRAKKTSIALLADLVARSLGAPVVDKAAIGGVYDFELRWTSDDLNPGGSVERAPAEN